MDYYELAITFASNLKGFKKGVVKQFDENQRGEAFALIVISKAKDGISPSEISKKIDVSTPRVCAILNSLEGKELITREVDKDNRRNIIVRATKEGLASADEHYREGIKKYAKLLEDLGENDAKELVRIICRLSEITNAREDEKK